jgi:poly(A) polymerase
MAASNEHADDVAFWREAQHQPGDVLAAQLDTQPEGESTGAPRRRRRRRRGSAASGE